MRHLVRHCLTCLLAVACTGSTEVRRVPTRISVTPTPVQLAAIGQTQVVTAVLRDASGDSIPGATFTWTGGGPIVSLTSTASGQATVTALANGQATISVASGGIGQSVPVFVRQAAAQLIKVGGDGQLGIPGQPLTEPVAVRVNDALGVAMANAVVVFAVTAGGGSVAASRDTTDTQGRASTTWVMGSVGLNSLLVTVEGAATQISFDATAQALGVPARIAVFVGNGQVALVGYRTNIRPAVRVTDAGDNSVAGASVVFVIASGGGSVSGANVTTNAQGVAQVGGWTVGAAPGTNTLTATVAGAGVIGNPVTFTATGQTSQFSITLRNVGSTPTPAVQAAFDSARARWERAIISDQTDGQVVDTAGGTGVCLGGPVNEAVDDVLILMQVVPIDGPGQVLGSAGPCFIRSTSRLTILGRMRFDSADMDNLAASGRLDAVILHEMGHVLGFGTLWTQTQFNCLRNPSAAGAPDSTIFVCARGLAMFDSLGGTSYSGLKVPVENCAPPLTCGAGTFNAHWRESVFDDELMTGFVEPAGTANPFSALSIAAMEDLGYTVNYAAADAYTRVFAAPAVARAGRLELRDDVDRGAIYVWDVQRRRVVGVIRP